MNVAMRTSEPDSATRRPSRPYMEPCRGLRAPSVRADCGQVVQAPVLGVRRRLGTVAGPDLRVEVGHVPLRRPGRDLECPRDLVRAATERDEREHLGLAQRETV